MSTPNANFKLKAREPGTPTPINLIVYFNKTFLKYSTGEKINPVFWNHEKQRTFSKKELKENQIKFNSDKIRELEKIQFKLNEYTSAIKTYFEHFVFQKINPSPEILREKLNNDFRPEQPKKKPKQVDLNTYIDNYIKNMETGKRLTEKDKKRYAYSTVKSFKGFQTQFNDYQNKKHRKLNYQHITIDFYNDFIQFFTEKKYSINTIGRHIKNLKTIMRSARDEGLHENNEIDRKQFKNLNAEVDSIYLTKNEVQELYKLDLSDNKILDVTRDVFLVGCYTAQRFSDYSRINKSNIRELETGTQVIDLKQQKTGEKVVIPIKSELMEILKKYDFDLPKTHEQKVNLHIKTVGEKAGMKEKIEIEEIKGGLIIKTKKFKYNLIKTHTARRTGATLMYLAGIPSIDIMKITGHKTEREFLKYIKVTKEQTAQNLALHPYFNKPNLKIVK